MASAKEITAPANRKRPQNCAVSQDVFSLWFAESYLLVSCQFHLKVTRCRIVTDLEFVFYDCGVALSSCGRAPNPKKRQFLSPCTYSIIYLSATSLYPHDANANCPSNASSSTLLTRWSIELWVYINSFKHFVLHYALFIPLLLLPNNAGPLMNFTAIAIIIIKPYVSSQSAFSVICTSDCQISTWNQRCERWNHSQMHHGEILNQEQSSKWRDGSRMNRFPAVAQREVSVGRESRRLPAH